MSSFIIIFVSLAILGQCQGDLIGDICSKSNNGALCREALRSAPAGANARGLAAVAVAKAASATTDAINVAKSVQNPGNKEIINTCIENFDDAVDNLDQCKPLISFPGRSKISDLQTKASAALTDVDTCSDEFGAKEPSNLKDASAKAYTLVQLVLIIVNTF